MNALNEDPRLDPQRQRRQLRELLRRNDLTGALRLAVEVDHVEARRIAHRLIQDGAAWSCVDSMRLPHPLVVYKEPSWVNQPVDDPRWISVSGSIVPVEWGHRRACLFACDCAETVLERFERKFEWDMAPREAIEMGRRWAAGNATRAELVTAASAAFESGARSTGYQARMAAWTAWSIEDESDCLTAAWVLESMVGIAGDEDKRERYARDVIDPIVLRWMLLPIEEVTS